VTYLDTSALLNLYVSEPESASLADFVVRLKSPLPYTALHELEIANAIEDDSIFANVAEADRYYDSIQNKIKKGE